MNITVSSKGQVVIPQEIREKLNIGEGQRVKIEEVGGTIVIVPIPKDPVRALRGSVSGIEESTRLVRALRKEWKE